MLFFTEIIFEILQKFEEIERQQAEKEDFPIKTVLVFILDNVSYMNESDWRFYHHLINITEERSRLLRYLVIVLNIEKEMQFLKPKNRIPVSSLGFLISENA